MLACLPYLTRSPSFRARWPASPGAPSSSSFRAGRPPPPPVGSPLLPLLMLAGHRFRAGFCLRFATPFSPPFTRANTHHASIGRASALRGALRLLIQNARKLISQAEVSARGRPACRFYRIGGRSSQGLSPPLAVAMRPPLTASQLSKVRLRQGKKNTSNPLKIKGN